MDLLQFLIGRGPETTQMNVLRPYPQGVPSSKGDTQVKSSPQLGAEYTVEQVPGTRVS